jgi:hypothetical protein
MTVTQRGQPLREQNPAYRPASTLYRPIDALPDCIGRRSSIVHFSKDIKTNKNARLNRALLHGAGGVPL